MVDRFLKILLIVGFDRKIIMQEATHLIEAHLLVQTNIVLVIFFITSSGGRLNDVLFILLNSFFNFIRICDKTMQWICSLEQRPSFVRVGQQENVVVGFDDGVFEY